MNNENIILPYSELRINFAAINSEFPLKFNRAQTLWKNQTKRERNENSLLQSRKKSYFDNMGIHVAFTLAEFIAQTMAAALIFTAILFS